MPTLRPVVVAVVLVQVGLPAVLLAGRWVLEGSRPVTELPASFQMYSATPPPAYTGVDADGRVLELDVDGLPLVLRRVGTGTVVPDRLCARDPDLVEVRRRGGPAPGTYPC